MSTVWYGMNMPIIISVNIVVLNRKVYFESR